MSQRGALVDTNLLLVFVIGSFDRALISRFKRTATYSEADFQLLVDELDAFDYVVTTPSVLAETSNHLGQLKSPAREIARQQLHAMVSTWQEKYAQSASLMSDSEFVRLGLTDVAICEASAPNHTVFTADLNLYMSLEQRGVAVVNFNHLRSARFGL